MQLFTIGPYELELDGRRKIDSDGKSIPSYTQNDIIEMAKVLTGWNLFTLMVESSRCSWRKLPTFNGFPSI